MAGSVLGVWIWFIPDKMNFGLSCFVVCLSQSKEFVSRDVNSYFKPFDLNFGMVLDLSGGFSPHPDGLII